MEKIIVVVDGTPIILEAQNIKAFADSVDGKRLWLVVKDVSGATPKLIAEFFKWDYWHRVDEVQSSEQSTKGVEE